MDEKQKISAEIKETVDYLNQKIKEAHELGLNVSIHQPMALLSSNDNKVSVSIYETIKY